MASYVSLHERVYVGHLDLSALTRSVSFGPLQCAMQPNASYGDGGYTTVLPGLISGGATLTANQDQAAGVLDASIGSLGTQYALTVIPNPTGTVTAADPCWIARSRLGEYQPLNGAVGEVASAGVTLPYDWATSRALVAHPLAARTATGNGTVVALAGPTAAQRLYAAVHVTAYSGLTNVVFTVESDDGAGFASATTRLTFATVTGTTNEFASVAGSFSTETHHRIVYTAIGAGSISFVAAFGVC